MAGLRASQICGGCATRAPASESFSGPPLLPGVGGRVTGPVSLRGSVSPRPLPHSCPSPLAGHFLIWHFPQGPGRVTAARSSRGRLGRGGQQDWDSPFLCRSSPSIPYGGHRSQREFPFCMIPQPKSHIQQDFPLPQGSCSPWLSSSVCSFWCHCRGSACL